MTEYKKGDWVRAVRGHMRQFTAGKVYRVSGVRGSTVFVELDDNGSTANGWSGCNFEPWQPKVGELVRVLYGHGWDGEGRVHHIDRRLVLVKMTTGGRAGEIGGFRATDLDPIVDAPAAAPTTTQHEPSAAINVAATVDAINDEYGPVVREVPPEQQARFKVGDRVDVVANSGGRVSYIGKSGVITKKHDTDAKAWRVAIDGDAMGGDYPFWEDEIAVVSFKSSPAIVCKIDNGQPLPATRPAVHTTVESADAEAKRLANLHTGQEFGVLTLTGAPHKVARAVGPGDKVIVSADLRVTSVSRGKANVVVDGGGSFTLPVAALTKAA